MRSLKTRKATGLRTEIGVHIALLMGAALLLAGLMLLQLVERDLVSQRVESVTQVMNTLAGSLTRLYPQAGRWDEEFIADATLSIEQLSAGLRIEEWGLRDRDLIMRNGSPAREDGRLSETDLSMLRYAAEPLVRLHYAAAWPWGKEEKSRVMVAAPIRHQGEFLGVLQVSFSMEDVRRRVISAQRFYLLYVLLYGSVLTFAGIFLLNRTVVRPVRRLQQVTRQVAEGNLETTASLEGPAEISDLAVSFNAMVAALRRSRRQAEEHIETLQLTNEELRQTQNELIRSEKMASVGHLAAGMAHEIGNPLGAVVGYLEFLKSESPPGREKEIVERALAETERIDRLVRELLDYAAPAGRETQTFDPVAAMAEARDILAHQGAFAGLVLDDRLPPALPATVMVRHRLVQVFINLLLNARDASSAGGAIRLRGGEEEGLVWLSVTDAGAGMSPATIAHIFDPFYTTKAPGKGRGLGLAVCQRVVGEAGGRIEVRSAPGQGSEFTVWLKNAEPAGHDA